MICPEPKKRAVFLDRDGTVVVDKGYLADVAGLELLPGAGAALARLAARGMTLIVVSNQSGIGRGFFTDDTVMAQGRRLAALLAAFGVTLAAVEFCPHTPDEGCACRKPEPGMLRRAAQRLGIDLKASVMVGDKESDVRAGHRAGCRAVRIGSDPATAADFQARDLTEAVGWIEGWLDDGGNASAGPAEASGSGDATAGRGRIPGEPPEAEAGGNDA